MAARARLVTEASQPLDPYPTRTADEPQWLERREPPIRTPWSPDAPLSRDQHADFSRDGFLVLPEVFHPSEIAAMQAELEALRTDSSSLEDETLILEPGSQDVRSIFAIHRQSRLFARVARDARLVALARYLTGDEVYIHQSRLNYKPGFNGKEFYWHSDFETWHAEDGMPCMQAVSVSILLTENRDVNGPLMLMPGSHRHFITCQGETPDDNYRNSLRRQEIGTPDRESLTKLAETCGIEAPTGPAGTVVVFDCNTMHGSNGNITPLPRANAFMVYNAAGNSLAAPYAAPRPRPEFIAARRHVETLEPVIGPIGAGRNWS